MFLFERYNLKLTTIMGCKKDNSPIPVIYMLSKQEREDIELKQLFENLKEWNSFNPTTIMTDCAANYALVISKYFPKANHRLCLWHVYRAWAAACKRFFKKDSNKIFGKLVSIQKILDKPRFVKELDAFLQKMPEDFKTYFEYYLKCIFKWAACGRTNLGVNVNTSLESLHRIIKRDQLASNFKFCID